MKILELELSYFGSHVHTKIAFGASTLIVGSLASGKSTIGAAIEYGLTGDCGSYRKRTDDRREIIHDLQPNKNLTVRIKTDAHEFVRTRAENGETWTFDGRAIENAGMMDARVTEAIGRSKTVIAAALNVSHFLDMDPTTQKELIIGLTGAEVTGEKIRQLFTGRPRAMALLAGQINSLPAIANAYDYAYKRRTVVNRELKELKPPAPPEGVAPPIEKIRALLNQLEGDLHKKIAEHAKASATDNRRIRETLETRAAVLRKLERPDDKVYGELQKKLKTEQNARPYLVEMAGTLEQKLRDAHAQVFAREANIGMLQKFNGRCVAGDHACPAPAADMAEALKVQQQLVARSKNAREEFATELDKIKKQIADDSAVRLAEKAVRDHEAAALNYDRQLGELATIDEQLKNLGADGDPAVVARLAEELATLRGRIAKGREQLESATGWLERERAVKAVAEARARLELELSLLEELVEFFGPKGVKTQLIDERIGKLEGEIAQHLKAFGFEFKIQIEPWQIQMSGRPITRLSRSERFRLGLAFQIAIAKMTGLNFVVCDDTELLTPEARGQMLGMIGQAKLDQAIILMTLMDQAKFIESRSKMPKSLQVLAVTNNDGISQVAEV